MQDAHRAARAAGGSRAGVAIVFATLIVVHFVATAGLRPLVSPDEGRYVSIARDMLASGDWVTPRLNGIPFLDKPILFYWLTAGGIALAGDTPFGMRLVPSLMGAAASLALYLLGARLFDRTTGFVAAAALATMPLFYLGAHFANMDVQVAFWITLTLACALLAIESPGSAARGRLWLGAWGCAALGLLTKGLIGIVLPGLVLGAWLLATRRWAVLAQARPASGLALFAAIALPWLVAVQWRNPAFFEYFFVFQHFGRYTGSGFNNPYPGWYYLAVLAVTLLPWSAFAPHATASTLRGLRARGERHDALLFVAIWAVVIVAFFSVPRSKPVGYILPAVPPLALLAGIAVSRAVGRPPAGLWRDPFAGWCLVMTLLAVAVAAWIEAQARLDSAFAQVRGLLGALLAAIVGSVALVAWLRHDLEDAARRRAAAVVVAVLGAAVCTLLIAQVPLETADAQRRLGLAMRQSLAGRQAPVAYFRNFPYSAPVYAKLREPALLVDAWDDPRTTADDNWRLTLWRGAGWQPGTRQRLFRTPAAFVAEAAGRPLTYVAVEGGDLQALQALAAAQPGLAARVLWQDERYALVALDGR